MKRYGLIQCGVALLGATALYAGAAMAQQSPTPTEHQMHDNTMTQEKLARGDRSVATRQEGYYNSLDRGNKGWLDTDDVSGDPFLSQNFGKCDMDHDGKLTISEFMACTHNNPPPPGSD